MVSWNSLFVACFAAIGVLADLDVTKRDNNELFIRGGTPSSIGTNNGYYYVFSTNGIGTVNYKNGAGGQYSVTWTDCGYFFAGKGWNPGSAQAITYNASYNPIGNSYLYIYGWTNNPLVEYYIIEDYGTYDPSTGLTHSGTVTSDGSLYDIYTNVRTNEPSPAGTANYTQYWSIRSSPRTNGTVTTSNHFNAWEALGLNIGTFVYQIVATEGYGSSGSSTVTVETPGATTNCSAKWAQCGGTGWTGPTCCASGSTCTYNNDWFSQCL